MWRNPEYYTSDHHSTQSVAQCLLSILIHRLNLPFPHPQCSDDSIKVLTCRPVFRCLVVEEGGEEEEVEARMEVDMVDKVDKEAVVVKGKSKVVRALEEATRHLRELGERVREARVMKIDVWSVSTRWR